LDLQHYLFRLFDHDDWANREILAALQAQPYTPHKAVRLMAHVVAVEYVWLARLKGEADPPVWPEWGLQEVTRQREALAGAVADYFASLESNSLQSAVEYTNTKGEHFTNTVTDILMHIVSHSAYHRGQVAMVMRDAGITPAYTDFIHGVRTKQVRE
jgi:uncharacterized damage-inducible protein DinB